MKAKIFPKNVSLRDRIIIKAMVIIGIITLLGERLDTPTNIGAAIVLALGFLVSPL